VEFVDSSKNLPLPNQPDQCALAKELLKDGQKLGRLTVQGMAEKKIHEVERLSALISNLCERKDINQVLDLGAGQGYLDIVLSNCYGLTVLGVDDDSQQTCGAMKRSEKKLKQAAKEFSHIPKKYQGRLYHLNKKVSFADTFDSLLKEAEEKSFVDRRKRDQISDDWLVCGLHTCGDLSPASISLFLKSNASILVNVGCCYNKLSELFDKEEISQETCGFPMSGKSRLEIVC
jgi:hypothetical protein